MITPDVAVSIIDNENGQTVGATRLDGRAPEACKAVESFLNQPLLGPTGSKALIGTPPDPKSLVDWLVLTVVHSKLDLTLDSIPDIAWPVLPILDLGFAPDGKTLGLLGQDGTVKLLEVMPGLTVRQTIGTQGDGVKVLDFSPSGKQIALGTQAGELQIWDLATGSKTNSFNDPVGKEIRRLAFSPNGQLLAAADKDNTINVWDVTTGKIDYTLSHSQGLKVAFAPDGQILAWANSVRSVEFVDAITGKPVATLQQTEIVVSPLSFSPDGKTMAVQLGNCQVAVFQVSTRQLLRNMGNDACRPFGISGAVVSPDGTTLAMTGSPSDRNAADQNAFLKFWDVETGQALRTIRVNQQAIANLVFSQHGLVAGSHGGAVTLWDVATGQQLSEYQNTVNPP